MVKFRGKNAGKFICRHSIFIKIKLIITMIPFVSAVFFLIITPGPAVLALAGVGASFSLNHGIKLLIGLAIGHILVSLLVITGLITIVFSVPHMRTVFLFLSTIFLLYLAIKIFIQGSSISCQIICLYQISLKA